MASKTRDSTPARRRILDVAGELFYRDGFRAVGVDTVVARSGVAKTTLYHHFASKDELIVAYLEDANERFWAWFDDAIAREREPRAQLVALFEAVGALALSPQCLGCTFQGTAAEFPEPDHPGHRTARAHKQKVLRRLEHMAAAAGARDPAEVARELLLLMDGAFAAARMFGRRESPATAVARAAQTLIDAHDPPPRS
ncbi:MAG TPA: TetR/AcrR family transcriptional regulator [Solirubrobacteraceae bacterium]|jgi:AcrR family transcriptional regulator|nr:TetR/AcrR family transcriptional regulator [Solirubrobacteraceae bacterium]